MAKQLPYSELTAISPLDGRYRSRIEELSPVVSEYALIKARIEVEIHFLIALLAFGVTRKFSNEEKKKLLSFIEDTDYKQIEKVKELEQTTRHDVKAMERTLRGMLEKTSLKDQVEMIHFGLTSEDVNNISYRLLLKRGTDVLIPILDQIIDVLIKLAKTYRDTPMLARTHGQPAVPTTLGKEFVVFAVRLNKEVRELEQRKLSGKITGAVGNFNALQYVYPKIDWIDFSEKFIASFGFSPNLYSTQTNPYEDVVAHLQNMHRIHSILIDFDQDVWRYISDNWFVQVAKKGEVGSSTMPQKVNPIDFENSEGNLGAANALIEFLARKLPISRLQRDLSDSTSIRNYGTILGYALIGYKSILTGLGRIKPNEKKLSEALYDDWAILGEGVQTLLRNEGFEDPYSLISSLTRGEKVDGAQWKAWVDQLEIKQTVKKQLYGLSPESYIGLAPQLTDRAIKEIIASRKKNEK